jgi:hypoxanthine-guanine phosphoribosyltransferase
MMRVSMYRVVPVDFFGWDCPNRFIVGYGMDYARMFITIPFIPSSHVLTI